MATGRPDWFGTIVSAGKYNSTYVPIAVDENGNLVALMQGEYGTVLKTIAVDEDGVMLANLSAQDLDFQTVRPAYGESVVVNGSKVITAGNTISITTVSGRGVTLGGWYQWGIGGGISMTALDLIVKTDDTLLEQITAGELHDGYDYTPINHPLTLQIYDNVNRDYRVALAPGLTFESSLEMAAYNSYGSDITVAYYLFYALTP